MPTLTRPSDDAFISYRTGAYKLHYYETPTNLKFVMLSDVKMNNLRAVLHQIYVNLYVEFGEERCTCWGFLWLNAGL
jgi:hypothetical protein